MMENKVIFKNESMEKLYSITPLSPSERLFLKILEVKMYLFTINIQDELPSFHEGRYNFQHRPTLSRIDKNITIIVRKSSLANIIY